MPYLLSTIEKTLSNFKHSVFENSLLSQAIIKVSSAKAFNLPIYSHLLTVTIFPNASSPAVHDSIISEAFSLHPCGAIDVTSCAMRLAIAVQLADIFYCRKLSANLNKRVDNGFACKVWRVYYWLIFKWTQFQVLRLNFWHMGF